MNTQTPFYIFSAEKAELSKEENASRTAFMKSYLRKAGTHFMLVNGKYKGVQECAFLVLDDGGYLLRSWVLNLARLYGQDTVLAIDANRQATLFSVSGMPLQELGQWEEITADQAANKDAVTEHCGRYWSTQS